MGKHREFKIEEIFGQFVLEFIWFENLSPYVGDVNFDLLHDFVKIVASIVEVSEHKHKFLCWLLSKQLKVTLKDNFKQAIVGGTVSSDILSPHVDHKNVWDSQSQHACSLLKSGSLIASFFRIGTFNIENKVNIMTCFIFAFTHPDTFSGLLSSTLIIHSFKLGIEQSIKQSRLATTLASNDSYALIFGLSFDQVVWFKELFELGAIFDKIN